MKNILFIVTFVIIACLSCDGKDRVHLSNAQILKEHKLLDSFSEDIKYFPEKYTEVAIDTILSNGFTVKIKTYADMENSILKTYKEDNIIHKKYYRNINSDIQIKNNNEIIYQATVNNAFLADRIKMNIQGFVISNITISEKSMLLNEPELYLRLDIKRMDDKEIIPFQFHIDKYGAANITNL